MSLFAIFRELLLMSSDISSFRQSTARSIPKTSLTANDLRRRGGARNNRGDEGATRACHGLKKLADSFNS
jgi:hypothetical protein